MYPYPILRSKQGNWIRNKYKVGEGVDSFQGDPLRILCEGQRLFSRSPEKERKLAQGRWLSFLNMHPK